MGEKEVTTGQLRELLFLEQELRKIGLDGLKQELQVAINRGKQRLHECKESVVDCGLEPQLDSCYSVDQRLRPHGTMTGEFVWNSKQVQCWTPRIEDKHGESVSREIQRLHVPVYPIQVLDFLLRHENKIPSWQRYAGVCFWTPCLFAGEVFIPGLEFRKTWKRVWYSLENEFNTNYPIAIRAGWSEFRG